jgi:hypothetical protein
MKKTKALNLVEELELRKRNVRKSDGNIKFFVTMFILIGMLYVITKTISYVFNDGAFILAPISFVYLTFAIFIIIALPVLGKSVIKEMKNYRLKFEEELSKHDIVNKNYYFIVTDDGESEVIQVIKKALIEDLPNDVTIEVLPQLLKLQNYYLRGIKTIKGLLVIDEIQNTKR